eukprot:Gb_09621 [translate_table: standard]
MRAGGCTVQQTLTAEAASVVKHAVALARRRGHAQVTPLHVAATLLSSGSSLLRRACLKSHPHSQSHPLQCRALELCFNVALNRLPTTAGPLVQGQPSLSNALVAALKRAQAHQRRGCLEQQQQPLLAVKVEMEQLIISILDDPSVSRVMREAGFSSTFVKNNVEETAAVFPSYSATISSDHGDHHAGRHIIRGLMEAHDQVGVNMGRNILSAAVSPLSCMGSASVAAAAAPNFWHCNNNNNNNNNNGQNFLGVEQNSAYKINPRLQSSALGLELSSSASRNEDVRNMVEVLLRKNKRRNTVIVGDCLLSTENVVRELMVRVERGDVPDPLKTVQFIIPQFSAFSFRLASKDDVEQKLEEMRRRISNCLVNGGVIIYAGDLRWAVDATAPPQQLQQQKNVDNYYCPVEHITMELGRILSCHAESRKLWLIATATYQTYMRCQMRQPSLETQWGLQAVPIPSGGLSLTLHASENSQDAISTGAGDVLLSIPQNLWPMPALKTVNSDHDELDKLNCCSECSANFEREAQTIQEEQNPSILHPGREQTQSNISPDHEKPSPSLPLWLQQCKNENTSISRDDAAVTQVSASGGEQRLRDLRKKWNQICRSCRHISCHASTGQATIQDSNVNNNRPMFNPPADLSKQNSFPSHNPWWCADPVQNQGFATSGKHPWSVVTSPSSTEVLNGNPTWKTHQFWSTVNENGTAHTDMIEKDSNLQPSTGSTYNPHDSLGLDVKTTLALGRPSSEAAGASLYATHKALNSVDNNEDFCYNMPTDSCHRSCCTRSNWHMITTIPSAVCPSRIDTRSPESMLSMGNEKIAQDTLERLRGNLRQFDAESLKNLCKGLEEKVPWQCQENILAIATAVLQCRSGMARRQGINLKGDTWLLILGPDRMGKRKIAKALAEIVFGSPDKIIRIGMNICQGYTQENYRGKTYIDRLTEAISLNPHSVVLLEEIDQADSVFMSGLIKAMERGKMVDSNAKEVSLSDAIILMTSNNIGTKYFTTSHCSVKGLQFEEGKLAAIKGTCTGMKLIVHDESKGTVHNLKNGSQFPALDCNIFSGISHSETKDAKLAQVGYSCKRKADWDAQESTASQCTLDKIRNKKSCLIPLDLNMQAEDHDDDGSTTGNGSDITQETVVQTLSGQSVMEHIVGCAREHFSDQFFRFLDKCVVFQPFDFAKLADVLLDKLGNSYSRVTNGRGSLEVDNPALEHIISSCWELAPSHIQVFEKWVEEVFEVSLAKMLSLHTLTTQTFVTLAVEDMGANGHDFYDNSCLPRRLVVPKA